MPEDESIIYVRIKRRVDADFDFDTVFSVGGHLDDMVNAVVSIDRMHDIILFAAAFLIKEEGIDINEYIKEI